jgi:hypothetical protein
MIVVRSTLQYALSFHAPTSGETLTMYPMALPEYIFHSFITYLLPEVCLYWRILGTQFYPLEIVT